MFFRIVSAFGWQEVTWAIYAYNPLSLKALGAILAHEMAGQTARFERFVANMLYVIAKGHRIDPEQVEPFGVQLDEIYKNPFRKPENEMTAEEIKQHVLERLNALG